MIVAESNSEAAPAPAEAAAPVEGGEAPAAPTEAAPAEVPAEAARKII